MPSLEQVLQFRERMHRESMDLIAKKGHDYNRQQQHDGDTLFNLRVAELLGIVGAAERGILVRLSDKFMRLISLMQPGVEGQVKGESIRDTVRDIHNYVDYALIIFEERQRQQIGAVSGAVSSNKSLDQEALQRLRDLQAIREKLNQEYAKRPDPSLGKQLPGEIPLREVGGYVPKVASLAMAETPPAFDVASEPDEVAEVGLGQYVPSDKMRR